MTVGSIFSRTPIVVMVQHFVAVMAFTRWVKSGVTGVVAFVVLPGRKTEPTMVGVPVALARTMYPLAREGGGV